MNTKSKIAVLVIGSLIVGYVAGAFFGLPETSGNAGRGDISKVSSFRKATVSSQTSALEQKLKSDTLAFNNESATVQLIGARMSDFANLVDYAIIAAGDKEELSEEVNSLMNVRELSENALQAARVASASLEYLSSGEKNELVKDYEQASQNLIVAFMMVDRQVQLGKQFVVAADKYLEGKSLNDVPELALVRDLWANYCGESAWLNGDKQELAYWESKTTISGSDIVEKGIQKLGSQSQPGVSTSGRLGSESQPGVSTSGRLGSESQPGVSTSNRLGIESQPGVSTSGRLGIESQPGVSTSNRLGIEGIPGSQIVTLGIEGSSVVKSSPVLGNQNQPGVSTSGRLGSENQPGVTTSGRLGNENRPGISTGSKLGNENRPSVNTGGFGTLGVHVQTNKRFQ